MKSKTLLHHINVLWSWNKRMSIPEEAPSHCSERPSHFQSSAAGDLHQLQRVPMNRPTDEVDNCTSNPRCSNPCTIVSLKVKVATFLTYSNMYAVHMSCCCWYHSCFAGLFFFERFNEKNGDQNSKKIRNWNQKPRSKNLVPAHWLLDEFYHDSSPPPTSSPMYLWKASTMPHPNSFRISVGHFQHSKTMTHPQNLEEVCVHVARLQELWSFSIHRYCQRQGGQCLTFGRLGGSQAPSYRENGTAP